MNGEENIFIMGAGVYQVPLIEAAKRLGHRTVVASSKGDYPGKQLADVFLEIDTTDSDSILAACEEFLPVGIVTTGSDVCVPSIGKVVDSLGLPGTGRKAAFRSMDKIAMKERFVANGVPTSNFQVCHSLEEAKNAAEKIGYPLAVKAADSSGSRGISKVQEISEMETGYMAAFNESKSKLVIVEEWLEGLEFGAQAIVVGDEIVDCIFHNDSTTMPPVVVPIGHSVPFNRKDLVNDSIEAITASIKSLGIRQTIANVDLIATDSGIKIIEVGARMGGTCIPELCSLITGVDFYEIAIRLSLGEEIAGPFERTKGFWAACLIRSPKDGYITKKSIDYEAINSEHIIEVKFDFLEGGNVRRFKTGNQRVGHIIVSSEKGVSEAEKYAEEFQLRFWGLLEWG